MTDIDNKKIKNTLDNLEMYKRIIDHMGESVWIWDENERTIYANPNFCNIMEYTLEEMIWRLSYEFRDTESAKTVENNNDKRKVWISSKYEWVLKSKTWKLIPVLCSWTPIPWGWTVWIMTDLSEMKDLEEKKEKLRELNKSKDEFISIVWHELRTPLTISNWYISMLLDWDMGDINQDMQNALLKIQSSNMHLLELVNDMLELSKIEMWSMTYYDEEIHMVNLVKTIYDDLLLIYNTRWIMFNLNIVWEFNNPYVYIDKNRIKQVITNLINNAFKFTKIWWKIDLTITDKDEYIEIHIIDTWIWISEEHLESVIKKFHQVESVFSRTNEWLWLWLSIISWILKNYNSNINITSKVGVWSNFYFSLKKYNSKYLCIS